MQSMKPIILESNAREHLAHNAIIVRYRYYYSKKVKNVFQRLAVNASKTMKYVI
jgi:hypothetical protein